MLHKVVYILHSVHIISEFKKPSLNPSDEYILEIRATAAENMATKKDLWLLSNHTSVRRV